MGVCSCLTVKFRRLFIEEGNGSEENWVLQEREKEELTI